MSESRVYDQQQISREITDINLEKSGSKWVDYKHKSGDREIRFKIWRLPDYPGARKGSKEVIPMLIIPNKNQAKS